MNEREFSITPFILLAKQMLGQKKLEYEEKSLLMKIPNFINNIKKWRKINKFNLADENF